MDDRPLLIEPNAPAPVGISRWRAATALGVAVGSDAISAAIAFFPFLAPVEVLVDLATAVALFVILGWRWLMLPALIAEAVPELSVFPFWALVVAAIVVGERRR